jgi:serine phosphatase RsbU (regulator of sigma subunit)
VSWSAWLICALVAGGVGYLGLAGFVWANRQGVGSKPLIVMLLAVKVWSLCYALELSSRSVAVAQWWSGLKYIGIVALPPALWSFVLAYTGRGRLSRRTLGLLLIHPVLLLSLLAIPATHDLLQVYGSPPDTLLGAPVPDAGWLFWPHAIYVYVLMLGADFTLMARLTRIAAPYRRQGALLIAASLLPCFGNVLYNAGALGPNMIDPTPFLFGITALVLVWGFFRLRLLDLTPVARGIVIEQMADGVMVLDVYGRVADVNKAGAAIVGYPRRSMVGRYAIDIVPGLAPVLQKADTGSETDSFEDEVLVYPTLVDESSPNGLREVRSGFGRRPEELTGGHRRGRELPPGRPLELGPQQSESFSGVEQSKVDGTGAGRSRPLSRRSLLEPLGAIPVPAAAGGRVPEQVVIGPPRDVAVSITWVTDPVGRQIARLVVLRDVTERNRTERQLRDLLAEQTKLSETLRQTLRPASLPQLSGLRLAARSVPSARGQGVGGDFYDVHPAGDGVSAFVLGDVSGKGVHAAVVTSMARYTVRTLSAQGWPPREVLQQLNRALQTPDDLERFCTVVYAHVLPPVAGAVASGVRLVLTLGGHPPPLLRRRDRTVTAVGRPGTALGLLPTVEVHEVIIDMAAGDVLLAYTDGVTEARDGEEQFGEKRLADVLAAVQDNFGPTCDDDAGTHRAAQLADAVADSVLSAVRSFSSERDDVALLVLAAT